MKKSITIIITICLIITLFPTVSQAAVTPHFIAVNDTLLPFGDDTMPNISGGAILVPYSVLASAGVGAVTFGSLDRVRLYRGSKQADIYAEQGLAEDGYGNALAWPSSKRENGKFYVPLHQVCNYFGLTYELIEVGRSVIPDTQIWVIRIISDARLNGSAFVAQYRSDMVAAYNAYYASPTVNGVTSEPMEEPPPSYSDVTIFLSFHDLSAGDPVEILRALNAGPEPGYAPCFFASAKDIVGSSGLIRKLSGSGYQIGILLIEGTFGEYQEASALLFEAAKIRTVLISASASASEIAVEMAEARGLQYWGSVECDGLEVEEDGEEEEEMSANSTAAQENASSVPENMSATQIIEAFPTESGERYNLILPCSESTLSALPEVLEYLQAYEYTIAKINEIVAPPQYAPMAAEE